MEVVLIKIHLRTSNKNVLHIVNFINFATKSKAIMPTIFFAFVRRQFFFNTNSAFSTKIVKAAVCIYQLRFIKIPLQISAIFFRNIPHCFNSLLKKNTIVNLFRSLQLTFNKIKNVYNGKLFSM